MRIIGITGPSGSGKTRLTEYLAGLGIPTVNADDLYHSMLIPPSACLDAIRAKFGDGVFYEDGSLDRNALSRIVFSDETKLKLLNRTVLGMVIEEIRKIITALEKQGKQTVVVDAPTLIESGFDRECDTVISVLSPADERVIRISRRDGISSQRAKERIRAQKDDIFYKAHSDIVIFNDGTEEQFDGKIRSLADKLSLK